MVVAVKRLGKKFGVKDLKKRDFSVAKGKRVLERKSSFGKENISSSAMQWHHISFCTVAPGSCSNMSS